MSINHYGAFNIIETSRSIVKVKHHLEIPHVLLILFVLSLLPRKLSYASCKKNSIDLYNVLMILHINSTNRIYALFKTIKNMQMRIFCILRYNQETVYLII